MAAKASDEENDAYDKTRVGVAPPPQVKRPPPVSEEAAPTAPSPMNETQVVSPPAEPNPDRTQASGAAPPILKPAAPSSAAAAPESKPGERTSLGITPPPKLPPQPQTVAPPGPSAPTPGPQPQSTPPPAPPPASAPPAAESDMEEEGTVVLTRARAARLQRVQPPGHSEMISLDRTSYLIGRSHHCDLLLYSSSASREHARLSFRDAAWYVQPESGKTVLANGGPVRGEQRLTHKMRLQFGADELLFFDETAATVTEVRSVQPAPQHRLFSSIIAGIVLVALGLAAWWLFANRSRLP